ncbi:mitochondrial k+-H+ exchange-related domain-containing protein [Sarocladium implicatum]|nr:mitochondrial k+-H+ exchange-related domain-containing protein [Sarocladium implicatum]
MRLYLLPISTRRTLIYAQRLHVATAENDPGLLNKAVGAAARLWTRWEARDKGWQKKVVDYGNYAMRRIPYEEWGLKSVPPLSVRRKTEELQGKEKVELVFPGKIVPLTKAEAIARTLATEREAVHRKNMIWCIIGMPITIPFALVPVIPNLPFFYLVFRAWSHWRAIAGGKHIKWLIDQKLLQPSPSEQLDKLYGVEDGQALAYGIATEDKAGKEEMLLTEKQARSFSDELEMPALTLELERAIWQVDEAIKKERGEAGDAASTSSSDNTGKLESSKEKES